MYLRTTAAVANRFFARPPRTPKNANTDIKQEKTHDQVPYHQRRDCPCHACRRFARHRAAANAAVVTHIGYVNTTAPVAVNHYGYTRVTPYGVKHVGYTRVWR